MTIQDTSAAEAAAELGNRLLNLMDRLEARIQAADIISWRTTDLTDAAHILLLIAQAKMAFHQGDAGLVWLLPGRIDDALAT